MASPSSTLLFLLLVDVSYSLPSRIYMTTSQSCTSSNIHPKTNINEQAVIGARYDEDEYPEHSDQLVYQDNDQEDPCKDIPKEIPIKVSCRYVPYPVSYKTYNTVCPSDRVSFYFDRMAYVTTLPGSAFKADFKISELHLADHRISKIAPGAFNYQSTIDSIFLKGNNLSTINVGIFNSLTHLHTLDLSENQIVNISEDAFSSVPLSKLWLNRNKLTSVPDALFNIRFLDVSYNNLEQISPSIGFEATVLNVRNNNIKHFNMTCFPRIRELYLANNQLEQIELDTADILKLDVRNNTISKFPENLKSLVMLNLGENKISHLPNKPIHGESLVELYLGQNNLTYIPSVCFKELTNLNILDLSGNKLSSFTFGTFDSLQNLMQLNISHNKFKTLPTHTLHAVKNLLYIYFSDNEITDLNVDDLFKHLPLLKGVDLRDNELSCQNLLDVVHKLKERGIYFEHGSFVESDNIYGMKCSHLDELSVKNKTKPLSIPFFEDLRNSSLPQYLDRLLEMDTKQNEVLDTIVTRLNGSGVEQDMFQKSLLKNYSLGTSDFVKQLGAIVNKTELTGVNYKELLTRYSDANNEMKNILRDILQTDKKQNELLNKLISEKSNEPNMSKSISFSNNSPSMMEQLVSILNNTDQRQNEALKAYAGIGSDVKKALEALEKTQVNQGHFIAEVLEKNQTDNNLNSALTDETVSNQKKAEALQSYSEESTFDRKYPIFIFMALLLSTMTVLMFVLLYVLFYRVKYVLNAKPDVELNQLLESKSDIVSN